MALEVGRLVARIDIEGSFEQKLTAAKSAMEDAAKSAGRFDDAMSKAGQSGAKLKVSDEPKRKIDDAAKSATKLDDGLSKASEAGKRLDVSNDARRKLDDTSTSAGKTATALDKASASGKNMQVSDQPRQKLSETASMAEQVNTKFSGLGITMKQVVGMAGGAAGLGAVLTKGWDRVTAIDTAQGKLRGLGHEAESVTAIMDSALESVTGTSYGLGDAATIAANAVAAGIQPGKDLTKYLTMTADASAIAGVSLGEMGRILNQVQTGQAAYAGDLSQLADRGIPIYQWLADEAGVAASEVKKMASTGQISSEMLFSAIQNNIGGAAKELGGTLVGSLANVGAAFSRLGAAAIDPFRDGIMAASEGAQDFAGALSSVVGPAASVAASALGGVASVVGKIPTPILAATGALVALQKTGLGPKMEGAASTAVGALKSVGETMVLGAGYARDNVKANGLFAASMDGIRGAAGGMRRGLSSIVDMLGGPWMIGLAGATVAVTAMIDSAQRAGDANQALAEASTNNAAAQRELGDALARSNGLMDEQATAASENVIGKIIENTQELAKSATGAFSIVDGPLHRMRNNYEALEAATSKYQGTASEGLHQANMSRLEMQALDDALAATGFSMEELNAIVREGGPEWHQVRSALSDTGRAGEGMIEKLEGGQETIGNLRDAALDAEPGAMALADAFKIMADEAATAADKAAALDAALVALAGPTYDADEAMANYWATATKTNEELNKLVSSGENMINVMEGGRLEFDLQTESGRNLRDMFVDMRKATVDTVASGGDLASVTAENARQMQHLADTTPYSIEQLEQLAERAGYFKDPIELAMNLVGSDEAAAEIAMVSQMLDGVNEGATVNVGIISDEAVAGLQALGFEVEKLPNGSVEVVAQTEEARIGLENILEVATGVDGKDPQVTVRAYTDEASARIREIFGELSELDMQRPEPELDLIIDKFMEGRHISHQELDELHARVADPKARLLIEELLRESARANLDLDNTARPRTATITPVLAAGSLGSIQASLNSMSFSVPVTGTLSSFGGADGGIRESYAGGGIGGVRGLRPWLEGATAGDASGSLPTRAVIQRPVGKRGLVQWAEEETQGEAFIPLAPSKRKRSRRIWAETGELLGINLGNLGEIASFADGGMLPDGDGKRGDMGGVLVPLFGKFADGGITAAGLVNFAKGVEGAPYVWGGVNWGDCSGAVSAIANYVSGRSPFGSRFATGNEGQALAERGFVSGRGSAGDLQIGWFNGGPYGGHTSATLPNGVNFEMGGGRGNGQYGGSAAGANHPQHTNHAHWPKERFEDAAADSLGGAAVDNRTPREKNIDAIVQEGQRRGLSDRDIQIALMTAEQESGIRVLNNPADPASMNMAAEGTGYDGTSTGIFQQQNNGAWGTLEDRMDPTKSAGMFYDELEKIEGRDNMRLTEVAQRVQGSAHPEAYAKWEGKASEELAASKARLESLSKTGGGSGDGQRVFVTNWPSGGGSYTRSSSSDAIEDAKDAVEDAQKAAFIQDQSIAALAASALGRSDLIQVEKFANGGFHGLENHTAHIAPAGSWRVFGEPEIGGEAYIPLASHKRARSTAILAETARRFGYTLGAGVNLVGSVLTGNGLDTGWGGPSLSDLGIDTGALRESLSPGVQAEAERAGMQIAAILQELGQSVDQQVEGTLARVDDGTAHLRQQYARAMI